jgi:hypothetical protein
MTHPTPETSIEVGIYDPSSRAGGSYWQWGNIRRDSLWETAAGEIHQGWPMRDEIGNRTSVLYGIIRRYGEESFWFYRVYPAGRDQFNRPGRYFFVLFRLRHVEDILNRQVSGVLEYFDTMRELPLKTTPLEKALPESPPDGRLVNLVTVLRGKPQSGHWGFDHVGEVLEFEAPKPGPQPSPLPPVLDSAHNTNAAKPSGLPSSQDGVQQLRDWLKARTRACLVGILIGLTVGHYTSRWLEPDPPPPPPKAPEPGPNTPSGLPRKCPQCGRTAPGTQGNYKDSRSSDTPKTTTVPTDGNTP